MGRLARVADRLIFNGDTIPRTWASSITSPSPTWPPWTTMTVGQAYARFNDIFWGEWLPETDYKSVIDTDWQPGSASIELYDPPDVDAADFSIEIWYPIIKKR